MNIRYAESKDITKIYNIEKRVFVNSWSKDSILQELKREKNSINLVCEINNNLVGYFFSHTIKKEIHILNLAIDIAFQHKGNGKAFFCMIFNNFLKHANVFLEVKRTNFPAINLYLGFRFEEIDIRKKYYIDGEDALVMFRKTN